MRLLLIYIGSVSKLKGGRGVGESEGEGGGVGVYVCCGWGMFCVCARSLPENNSSRLSVNGPS